MKCKEQIAIIEDFSNLFPLLTDSKWSGSIATLWCNDSSLSDFDTKINDEVTGVAGAIFGRRRSSCLLLSSSPTSSVVDSRELGFISSYKKNKILT